MQHFFFSLILVLTSAVGFNDTLRDPSFPLTSKTHPRESVRLPGQETESPEQRPQVTSTVPVPPGILIENEGDVLIDVRTVNTVVDTAWIVRSSGHPEVDDFALKFVHNDFKPARLGFGDPPLLMLVSVKIPFYTIDDIVQSTNPRRDEVINISVMIPPGSEVKSEGDVLFQVHLDGTQIDSFQMARSSGYSEVDEIANERVQSMKRNKFKTNLKDLWFRVFVRRSSK